MIVDTSALVAILAAEPDHERLVLALETAGWRSMSAGSWIELGAVLTRRFGGAMIDDLDNLMSELRVAIEPVTVEQAHIGRAAYQRYGRGSGHAADLNFGDCFSYALAKATGRPLLFKGDDFARTDIAAALA